MSDSNPTSDAPQINILPVDTHGDILVQLIRGQERAATALEFQNRRLFGGDGQPGSIPALFQLQHDLAAKLDANKDALMDKISAAKADLSAEMSVDKQQVDEDIENLECRQQDLEKKINWYGGGIATLGAAATFVLGYLGLRAKAGH
jgi:hypothetical protein